jgi:Protein of unknown function (DUF421)
VNRGRVDRKDLFSLRLLGHRESVGTNSCASHCAANRVHILATSASSPWAADTERNAPARLCEGRVIPPTLSRQRMTVDDVHEAAREQGIGDLATVRVAILEPHGKISFITSNGAQQSGNAEHRLAE